MAGWHYSYYVQWLGLGVPLVLTAVTEAGRLKSERRKDVLKRINDQLKYFYGPLLACVTSSKSAFEAMVTSSSPDKKRSTFLTLRKQNPNGACAIAYRRWTRQVFQPLNERYVMNDELVNSRFEGRSTHLVFNDCRAARLVVEHADLLEGDKFEPILLQLVAHVSATRVMLKQWGNGDFSSSSSSIPYPDEIHIWARRAFAELKRKQAKYLGFEISHKQEESMPSRL